MNMVTNDYRERERLEKQLRPEANRNDQRYDRREERERERAGKRQHHNSRKPRQAGGDTARGHGIRPYKDSTNSLE